MARPASEFTMLEIIEAVRGPIPRPLEVVEATKGAAFAKKMEALFDKATWIDWKPLWSGERKGQD